MKQRNISAAIFGILVIGTTSVYADSSSDAAANATAIGPGSSVVDVVNTTTTNANAGAQSNGNINNSTTSSNATGGAGGSVTLTNAPVIDVKGGNVDAKGGSSSAVTGPSDAKIDFSYKTVSIGSTIPKPQAATNASAFVPTPGVMQEFLIDSAASKEAAVLNLYAAQECGPKAYTSGKFQVIKEKLTSENSDGDDVEVNVTFAPRPDFNLNTDDEEAKPSAAFVAYHEEVNWSDKYTCLGVINVDPVHENEQLDHDVLQNAAGAFTSGKAFGKYGTVVSVYTRGTMRFRSGSSSEVTTVGVTVSGSGAPGTQGFAQGAIGYGNTEGALVHTDVSSLRLVVLAVNPQGRTLKSYGKFETDLLDEFILQRNHQNQLSASPVATQSVGSATGVK